MFARPWCWNKYTFLFTALYLVYNQRCTLLSTFNDIDRPLTNKKNFVASFYGWRSTTSGIEPLWEGSLRFTTKFREIHGTHFIDLGRGNTIIIYFFHRFDIDLILDKSANTLTFNATLIFCNKVFSVSVCISLTLYSLYKLSSSVCFHHSLIVFYSFLH